MSIALANIADIDWEKSGGLVPAIIQHHGSGAVLMLGYMNREALDATLARGRAVFFSRTRQRLWEKGETSGHYLEVTDLRLDCDSDTLLVRAIPHGPVCHTGASTCFGDAQGSEAESLAFLAELEDVIARRIAESPDGSYTARLFASGQRRIAQKVGEEGLEVALAAVAESDPQLIGEGADLLYHLLVLLKSRGLRLQQLVDELRERHTSRSGTAT